MLDARSSTPFLFFAEKWLQKRKQSQLKNVSVRDILITQKLQTQGEFHGDSEELRGHFIRLREESDQQLVARIITHIQVTCMEPRSIHLNDNFINPDNFEKTLLAEKKQLDVPLAEYEYCKIQTDCENNVTRVTYNEFSFYPYLNKGPFSLETYNLLVTKLSLLAESYPENFHIIVASLPVLLYGNRVVNLAIHIQCGREPVLHPFIKAIPSALDGEYKETRSYYPTAGGPVRGRRRRLSEFQQKIANIIRGNQWNELIDVIGKIKLFCNEDDEFRYTEQDHKRELPALVKLSIDCEAILNLLRRNYIDHISQLIILSHSLMENLKKLNIILQFISKEYLTNVRNLMTTREATQVVAGCGPNNITQYQGGFIECKTFGGVKFITIIDICLDHRVGIGAALLSAYMEMCLRSGDAEIPEWVSYVITSNTVRIVPDKFVTEELVQCDTYSKGRKNTNGNDIEVSEADTKNVQLSVFGPTAKMTIYPPRIISPMLAECYRKRERYNLIIRDKQRLQFLNAQHVAGTGIAEAVSQLETMIDCLTVKRDIPATLIDPTNQFQYESSHFYSDSLSLQNIDYINHALNRGLDPNKRIADIPLLHWSIKLRFVGTALYLLSATGINLILRDRNGDSALDVAGREDITSVVCVLYNDTGCQQTRLHFLNHHYKFLSAETKAKLLILAVDLNRVEDVGVMLRFGAASIVNDVFLKRVNACNDSGMIAAFHTYALKNDKQWALPVTLSQQTFDSIVSQLTEDEIKNNIGRLFPRLEIKNRKLR